ncbi:MAG: NAD(P)H-dependent oxidoreductase [Lachnospiraceae bacterium]|nr:NAD(P)H-dependent oxidoreductase [Lachnospiraceae bacterium]
MKDLIVYYSLEGNTEYVAEKIAAKTGADTLRLVPKKAYHDKGFAKFFWGGKSAVMAEKPELEKYDIDLSQYERIIFGTPIWASNITPPLRTFIDENKEALKGKSFAAFACQSGAGAEKAFAKLSKLLGIEGLLPSAIFIDPKAKGSEDKDAQIDKFAETLSGSNAVK